MDAETNKLTKLNVPLIKTYQQNRYPLLFLDEVTEVVPGKYAKAVKNFTYDEWFFPAHFEDEPSVPGFIQMEVLAQTFIMTFLSFPEHKGKKTAFVKADNVMFKRQIVPGDRLEITATLNSFRHGIARGHVESYVDEEVACTAEFIIALPDIVKALSPKKSAV